MGLPPVIQKNWHSGRLRRLRRLEAVLEPNFDHKDVDKLGIETMKYWDYLGLTIKYRDYIGINHEILGLSGTILGIMGMN